MNAAARRPISSPSPSYPAPSRFLIAHGSSLSAFPREVTTRLAGTLNRNIGKDLATMAAALAFDRDKAV